MASIRKRGSAYQITVSNGYTQDGKKILETVTWHPDPERTQRQNEKALQQFVVDFERKVQSGKYMDGEKSPSRNLQNIGLMTTPRQT